MFSFGYRNNEPMFDKNSLLYTIKGMGPYDNKVTGDTSTKTALEVRCLNKPHSDLDCRWMSSLLHGELTERKT